MKLGVGRNGFLFIAIDQSVDINQKLKQPGRGWITCFFENTYT